YSGVSKEEQFNLLSHHNNASLVEDSLKLVSRSSGLAVSTVVHYGVWYSICKSTKLLSDLARRFSSINTEKNNLQEVKSSFCNQLAAVLTSTEVALAGKVSPWPLERLWWLPLRFAGTGFAGYRAYTTQDPYFIPIMTMAYFTHEVVARTAAAADTVQALKHHDRRSIQPEDFVFSEYALLKSMAGLMIGTIVYEKLVSKGFSPVEASFVYLLSASLSKSILAIGYLSASNSESAHASEVEAGAEILAGALAGSLAVATDGAIGVVAAWSLNPVLFIAAVGTLAFSLPEVESIYRVKDKVLSGAQTGVGVGIGVMVILIKQNSYLDSNRLLRNVAITLTPALALALINGLSNNAVCGVALEESFTETARIQWQKFYAPLDYLYTLFN
ncbi:MULTISPECIES: hypothetical protein, partial [unclassified Endozoicomonas]|uniref:hypothetical protein n=1 Tax=unclassified Endozoicomonas TaxID=2644528 RepID=UPI0021473C45